LTGEKVLHITAYVILRENEEEHWGAPHPFIRRINIEKILLKQKKAQYTQQYA
jgi:hypothetical protein